MNAVRGFTLIELMIAVVILGILSAVAFPSYQHYMREGKRTEAIKTLQTILDGQERFYLRNDTYTTTLGSGGLGLNVNASDQVVTDDYTISARTCTDTSGNAMPLTLCIEMLADATGNQAQDGDIILNSMGRAVRNDGTERLLTE